MSQPAFHYNEKIFQEVHIAQDTFYIFNLSIFCSAFLLCIIKHAMSVQYVLCLSPYPVPTTSLLTYYNVSVFSLYLLVVFVTLGMLLLLSGLIYLTAYRKSACLCSLISFRILSFAFACLPGYLCMWAPSSTLLQILFCLCLYACLNITALTYLLSCQ